MARLLMVLAGIACHVSPAFAQVKLAWQLEKGDRLLVERTLEQKLLIESKSRPLKQESSAQWTSSLTVADKTKDGYVLAWKIESMTRKLTDAATKNPVDKLGEQLKGATFQVTMSPAGRVGKLEGYEELVKKLAPKMPDLEKALRALMPPGVLTEALEESLAFLPEKEVKPGERWKRQAVDSLAPFGTFHAAIDYEYQGEKAGKHQVKGAIGLTYQPPKESMGVLKIAQGEVKTDKGQIQYTFDPVARSLQAEKTLQYKGKLSLETPKGKDFLAFVAETHLRIRVTLADGAKNEVGECRLGLPRPALGFALLTSRQR